MAIFMGPDAYVTPSWYATKQETAKVVLTWNYVAVHAYGPVEFFQDPERLLDVGTRLTKLHEEPRTLPWTVSIAAQLRGIVGVRLPIRGIEGKRKMSQNCPEAETASRIPWWAWSGGLFGALFIGLAILLIPKPGAATFIALLVTGQMLAA